MGRPLVVVRTLSDPWIWAAQGPPVPKPRRTYGWKGHGYNPISLGGFSDWWAVPCNRTMLLAAIAAAAASAVATAVARKNEKEKKKAHPAAP